MYETARPQQGDDERTPDVGAAGAAELEQRPQKTAANSLLGRKRFRIRCDSGRVFEALANDAGLAQAAVASVDKKRQAGLHRFQTAVIPVFGPEPTKEGVKPDLVSVRELDVDELTGRAD